jgi:peptidoglycan/LPS O-acetylase OafA/YrhL
MQRRPDIDGLRAVAIASVVLYHTGLLPVPGGFSGVDIFFVISGYLITGIICEEVVSGRFSLPGFYERRARRILPALFVILLFASLSAYHLLGPSDLKAFGVSLWATLFFSSNLLFVGSTDYFGPGAEATPLLHMWSLAVEEQFYIAYPILILVLSRFAQRHVARALAATLLVSLAWNFLQLQTQPLSAFYTAPSRAWELLLGGLIATKVMPSVRHQRSASLLGFLGFGLLGYGLLAIPPAVASVPTGLYSCLGTALVIYSGVARRTVVSEMLSVRPMVFLGLISYSLYLWHWVLLVVLHLYLLRTLDGAEMCGAVALSVLIASVSWRFVETPFRTRSFIRSREHFFRTALGCAVLLGAFGVLTGLSQGLPNRFTRNQVIMIAAAKDIWPRSFECDSRICRVGSANAQESFLLWGDSHAGAMAPAIERVALDNHMAGYIAFHNACAPLLTMERLDLPATKCAAFSESVLAFIRLHHIGTVLLHARWALYANSGQHERGEVPAFFTTRQSAGETSATFEPMLMRTVKELRGMGVKVILVASTPGSEVDVPVALARRAIAANRAVPMLSYADFMVQQARAFAVLHHVSATYSARIAYPHKLLCASQACLVVKDGYPLYSDAHHLSVHGSLLMVPMLQEVLVPIAVNPDLGTRKMQAP